MAILEPTLKSLFVEALFNEQVLGGATGFVVVGTAGPALITNWHVVKGEHPETGELAPHGGIPNRIRVYYHKTGAMGECVPVTHDLLDASDQPLWKEHPTFGKRVDVVALPIGRPPAGVFADAYPHDIVSSIQPNISPTDSVSVVGFPFGIRSGGYLPVWVNGTVATEPEIDHDGLPLILIDCRARQGQSGSPVIFHSNSGFVRQGGGQSLFDGPISVLLGVYSGRVNKDSDLGRVWKLRVIEEILAGFEFGPFFPIGTPLPQIPPITLGIEGMEGFSNTGF